MRPELAALAAFADELADAADAISLDRFGGLLPATAKPDGSPVTEADRAIERALRQRIAERWPGHAVLGEEEGGGLQGATPTWVIDPIDATKNFMRGIPIFATLIAVVVEGEPVVGVVSAPAMGERWAARRGGGATRNGEPVTVSAIAALEDSHLLHGGLSWWREDPHRWECFGRVADTAWRTRGFGDFWMHLLVAGGQAEGAFERDLKPWDIAAPACVVTEAGGRVTGFAGEPALATGDVVSSNGLVHDELLALLTPTPARNG